jgi:pimeloyl-[acyl-carrier protein] synthase
MPIHPAPPRVRTIDPDPHAHWHELRRSDPVHWNELSRCWVLTRHDDVRRVLRDPTFVSRDSREPHSDPGRPLAAMREHMLIFLDGGDHARLRALAREAFAPRRLGQLRRRVESLSDEILDDIARRGHTELVRDVAGALPVRVIGDLMGLPEEELPRMRRWSDALAASLVELDKPPETETEATQGLEGLVALIESTLAERHARPRNDLLSVLAAAEARGGLGHQELLASAVLLFLAGHETTGNLVGNAIALLLEHEDARRRLDRDPRCIATAVEEFLRFDGPLRATRRIAAAPCTLRGRRIRRGDRVLAVLAAANRDPGVFPDPDRLRIDRAPNPHLSFGHGRHFCLGATLARIEAQVVIGTFVRRFPDFRSDEEGPQWRSSTNLRGLASLHLRL